MCGTKRLQQSVTSVQDLLQTRQAVRFVFVVGGDVRCKNWGGGGLFDLNLLYVDKCNAIYLAVKHLKFGAPRSCKLLLFAKIGYTDTGILCISVQWTSLPETTRLAAA